MKEEGRKEEGWKKLRGEGLKKGRSYERSAVAVQR